MYVVCVCVYVCVCPSSPAVPRPYCGAEQKNPPSTPQPHMTPHPRSSSRARKQLHDLPAGKNYPLKSARVLASAKMASAIDVRIDDVGSILKFRIGLPFGENSAGFCQSVWPPGSILKFRIGSVSSIGGFIAATLFADTISDPKTQKK